MTGIYVLQRKQEKHLIPNELYMHTALQAKGTIQSWKFSSPGGCLDLSAH
jgi:hypothetical protein